MKKMLKNNLELAICFIDMKPSNKYKNNKKKC